MNKPPATERGHNTVTYMALKDDLKKLNEIAHSDAPDAMERYTALSDEITAKYQSPEDASEIELGQEAEEMINYMTVKQQIAPYADIIPLGYIAKKYFGKSTAWLSQRINGTKVRGKVYTLSKKDLETFNFALQDISRKLGSISIA